MAHINILPVLDFIELIFEPSHVMPDGTASNHKNSTLNLQDLLEIINMKVSHNP